MPGDLATLRGRIGAYKLHATHDPRETTAKARATFLAKFLDAVDPSLPQAERLRRAEAARKAHFARLAYRSAVVRSAKKAPTATDTVSAQEVTRGSAATPTS